MVIPADIKIKLISEKYSMEISIDKTKIMAFCGKYPVVVVTNLWLTAPKGATPVN